METLKGFFWNHIAEEFPDELAEFLTWLDLYKDSLAIAMPGMEHVKFVNFPFEFQMGVVFKFFRDEWQERDISVGDVGYELEVLQVMRDIFSKHFLEKLQTQIQEGGDE